MEILVAYVPTRAAQAHLRAVLRMSGHQCSIRVGVSVDASLTKQRQGLNTRKDREPSTRRPSGDRRPCVVHLKNVHVAHNAGSNSLAMEDNEQRSWPGPLARPPPRGPHRGPCPFPLAGKGCLKHARSHLPGAKCTYATYEDDLHNGDGGRHEKGQQQRLPHTGALTTDRPLNVVRVVRLLPNNNVLV